MDWNLVVAAVGGGVVVAVAEPVVRIPRTLAEHDLRIAVLNRDGRRWVDDETRDLKTRLQSMTTDATAKGALMSGAHVQARQYYTEAFEQRLRDRVSDSQDEVDLLCVQERLPHRLWRRVRHRDRPVLVFRERALSALAEWREEQVRFCISVNAPSPVWTHSDPIDPAP